MGRTKLGNQYVPHPVIPGVSYMWITSHDVRHAVLVDTEDVPLLRAHTWMWLRRYAATRIGVTRKVLYLHRYILCAQPGERVRFRDSTRKGAALADYTRANLSVKKTGRRPDGD